MTDEPSRPDDHPRAEEGASPAVPDHLAHLPIGVPITMPPEDSIAGWEIFPFEYEGLRVKPLGPVDLPEPPRSGEAGPDGCLACTDEPAGLLWSDDDWYVRSFGPSSVPAILVLSPVAHADLGDLSPGMFASMGTMIGRLDAAMSSLDGVARVHLNKWGDGGAHLHWVAIARPAGLQQLRGSCLVLWDDVLPNLPEDRHRANLAEVAAALAADGGRDHLAPT